MIFTGFACFVDSLLNLSPSPLSGLIGLSTEKFGFVEGDQPKKVKREF